MDEKDLTAPEQPAAGDPSDQEPAVQPATEAVPDADGVAASTVAETGLEKPEPGPAIADADGPVATSEASAAEVATDAVPESEPEVVVVDVPPQEPVPDADEAFVAAEPAPEQPDITGLEQEFGLDTQSTTGAETEEARQLAVLEAIVYVTDEPLSAEQIARAMNQPLPDVKVLLDKLVAEYNRPEHGLTVKEVAGGYKIATKPEHHEAVRTFVKNLNPPLKLSLAALETLAVIAYKQPITAPEIMEIRGVQGAGVLKTLIDRKLITTAGRKNVVGKPILYKTTKEFLVQFGLKDLSELPTLKEFEDLRRMAFSDVEEPSEAAAEEPADASESTAEDVEPAAEPPKSEEVAE